MTTDDERKTYSSTKGVALVLRPVSQFKLDSLRASKDELPPPTYEVKVTGGDTILYPMDAEIAKNKGRVDEWNAYIEKVKASDAKYGEKFTELIIWEGIDVDVPDVESEWQKQSEYFGLKVPSDPIKRKLFYVYNELLGAPNDIGELIAQIMTVSQMDEGAVAKLRETFRIGIQRASDNQLPKKQRKLANKKSDT